MHMALVRWVVFVCMLVAAPLSAGSPSSRPLSSYETRLDLVGPVQFSPVLLPTLLQETALPEKKSVGLAAFYSLVVPGMGELYVGAFNSGKYFLAAEGVLWLTYGAFDIYGNSLRDDARAFAQAHAGASTTGKSDQFFVDLGNFLSVELYNDKKLRDRDVEVLYDPALGYGWQWDSDASRATFRDRRVAAEKMYNNRKFVVAAVLINHVASAINAARAAIAHNNAADEALGDLQFGARVLGGWDQPHGLLFTVAKGF